MNNCKEYLKIFKKYWKWYSRMYMLIAYGNMANIPYEAVTKKGFQRIFINMNLYYIKGNIQI